MSAPVDREAVEAAVRQALARGDLRTALELGLAAYGDEVLGYLVALLRDEAAGREVYADLGEQVWKGLAAFRSDASFRTYLYAVAFRRAARHRRTLRRRREQAFGSTAAQQPAASRTSTALHAKTEARSWLEAARAALSASEQSLLTLRVDRALSWDEVAAVMGIDSALARKRFERLKQRLRAAAERDGILGR